MKLSYFVSLFAAGSALAYPRHEERAVAANPTKSGLQFTIDGVTKYYPGTNSYWIGFLTNNNDVDLVMSHLNSSGLKILRVWGFNDVNSIPGSGTVYYQSLVPGSDPVINTGANGLQRLDAVVKSAEKYGIKLIINFVNNWTDYGGMAAYLNYYTKTTGNTATNNPSWYNNTAAQAQYQKYIKAVVSRYTSSSAIFAWELANEPRCNGCDTNVIYNWVKTTSAYIKSLDSGHMVAIGDEGFGLPGVSDYPHGYSEGTDFVKNLGISTIDFGTFHLYPQSWGTTADWGNTWVTDHAKACVTANKPCMLEEFGYSDTCSVESQWQKTSNSTRGMASDLFWQLGDQLSTGQTNNDGNAVYYGNNALWNCIVTDHVKK